MNQQNIERAAHLFESHYPEAVWEMLRQEGIPNTEGKAGAALWRHRRDVRQLQTRWYGDPAHGSHPPEAAAEREQKEMEFKRSHPEWFS